jgi:hypothetical protein
MMESSVLTIMLLPLNVCDECMYEERCNGCVCGNKLLHMCV